MPFGRQPPACGLQFAALPPLKVVLFFHALLQHLEGEWLDESLTLGGGVLISTL
jgi:hypothetical protein